MASSRIQSRNSPTVSPRNRREDVTVERLEDQPAHLVLIGIDQRMVDDLAEGQVRENQLGGDALALGPRRQPGELVARLLLVGRAKTARRSAKTNRSLRMTVDRFTALLPTRRTIASATNQVTDHSRKAADNTHQ